MTPAAFDTRRRSLGLTIHETASLCGSPVGTVENWQDGVSPIPDDAMEALDRLEVTMAHAAERMAEKALRLNRPGSLILLRYRTQDDIDLTDWELPLGAHAMMIAWTAQGMEADGVEARIEWAAPRIEVGENGLVT